MAGEDLLKAISELRSALYIIEEDLTLEKPGPEAVEALTEAVDNLRGTVWTVLSNQHAGKHEQLLARVRVRRAIELCDEVLSDLYTETLTKSTPGLSVFHATLKDLSAACEQAIHD